MKKFLISFVVLIVLVGGYFAYTFYLSPVDNFRSIYLIPRNAVYILQTDKPIETWKRISGSGIWKHMQKQAYFAELTSSTNSLNEILENNKQLFDLFGSRNVTISAHVYAPKRYDFLFIVDLEKAAKLNFVQDYFTKLGGKDYQITERNYKGQRIYELLDKSDRSTLYLTFIKNLVVCSYVNKILEESIDQQENPYIGRDLHFIEMRQEVDDGGLFNVYLQYNYLDELMRCYLAEEDDNINELSRALYYTGLNVDLTSDNRFITKGYTNVNDSVSSYLKAMLLSGKGKLHAHEVIPQRTAFYMSLGVENFTKFYDNFISLMKEKGTDYDEYQKNIDQIEKLLKINVKENFISWIGDEVAFVQTQPKGLGKDNEFAVVIKSKNREEAVKNLDFVARQIRKKTPVKFKEVDYKGYPINFLSVKGMFKVILGKFFEKLDKPYFTVIDDYVIFSNHPQTIKNIIDDYKSELTLAKSEEFGTFLDQFDRKNNIFIYVHPPILHGSLQGFVSHETWLDVKKNKDYITCFPQFGFQLTEHKGMFATHMISTFGDPAIVEAPAVVPAKVSAPVVEVEEEEVEYYVEDKDEDIFLDDLDVKRHEEFYEDGTLKLKVGIKNGVRHGSFTEYHPNGKGKVKGRYRNDLRDGTFKYYDESGKLKEKRVFKEGVLQ
ncbi:MAG: DUF3352 domain-containing protein [Cytophagaceae bacterium]